MADYHDLGQPPLVPKVFQREITVQLQDGFTGSRLSFAASRSLTDVDEITSLRQELHAKLDKALDAIRVNK